MRFQLRKYRTVIPASIDVEIYTVISKFYSFDEAVAAYKAAIRSDESSYFALMQVKEAVILETLSRLEYDK